MRLHSDYITHSVGDEHVMVATGESTSSFCGIVKGNDTAALIFDILKEEVTREEIIEKLSLNFPTAPIEYITEDVDMVLDKLKSVGALVNED